MLPGRAAPSSRNRIRRCRGISPITSNVMPSNQKSPSNSSAALVASGWPSPAGAPALAPNISGVVHVMARRALGGILRRRCVNQERAGRVPPCPYREPRAGAAEGTASTVLELLVLPPLPTQLTALVAAQPVRTRVPLLLRHPVSVAPADGSYSCANCFRCPSGLDHLDHLLTKLGRARLMCLGNVSV